MCLTAMALPVLPTYHPIIVVGRRSPPKPLYSRLIVTTCLYASALVIAKLGRWLHP